MFTGIIEEVGTIRRVETRDGGRGLVIRGGRVLQDCSQGASIAVSGVCLTVEKPEGDTFSAFLSAETLSRTTLDRARAGTPVNLERALAFGDRLGGHLLTGHVEAVGRIERMDRAGEGYVMRVSCPEEFRPYLVHKGSVAVDGVSLTVARLEGGSFEVSLVPETVENTTFALKTRGDFVNLEPDLILKYVIAAVRNLDHSGGAGSLTLEKLKGSGFVTD